VNDQDGDICIEGMDEEAIRAFKRDMDWHRANDETPAIILAHNPLAFDILPEDQEVLVLAGDTHGGQIPLPSWLWRILGYEKCARYNQGLFRKGKKRMYVSRGIGTSHLPLRIFRRPEVVVLHFSASEGRN